MKILAIDAATEACSVALLIDNAVQEKFELAPRGHTELILPMVDALLNESNTSLSQLDAIAVNQGPGSFTGVRICAGVAQGLAFSSDVPIIPVTSLAALAYAVSEQTGKNKILAMIDARMNEVYWGYYKVSPSSLTLQGDVSVAAIANLPESVMSEDGIVLVGTGALQYRTELDKLYQVSLLLDEDFLYPHAASVAKLAERDFEQNLWVSADKYEPVYIRNQVTQAK